MCLFMEHIQKANSSLQLMFAFIVHSCVSSFLKVNGIIYTSFKIGTGYEIKEGKYYNYLTKDEMIQTLNKTGKSVELVDYFETLPSTRRKAENTIGGNFIIKKFE